MAKKKLPQPDPTPNGTPTPTPTPTPTGGSHTLKTRGLEVIQCRVPVGQRARLRKAAINDGARNVGEWLASLALARAEVVLKKIEG